MNHRTSLLVPLVLCLSSPLVFPQSDEPAPREPLEPVELDVYLPGAAGDHWRFQSLSGESFLVTLEGARLDERPVLRIVEGNAGYALGRFDPERGRQILFLDHGDGTTSRFERPVTLLPLEIAMGETHRSQGRFVLRAGGEKKDVGSHYFEVTLERRERVETPRGNFENCLVLRTVATRMDFSGSETHLERRVWLARGIGPVRIEQESRRLSASGELVSQQGMGGRLSATSLDTEALR